MNENKFYFKRNIDVFNTPIEMGLRALIVLNEVAPNFLDLNRIIIYDYLITHSGDVDNSMTSLHPAIPHRSGELIIKRKVMQQGLNLMCSRELIDIVYSEYGIGYKANPLCEYFIRYFDTAYAKSLVEYSRWLKGRFEHYTDNELNDYINKNITKWGSEFTKESLMRGGYGE